MLAVYIGLFLNGAVLFRRVEGYFEHLTVRNGIFAAIEVFGSILATFFLLRLLSLLADVHGRFWPRWWWLSPPPQAIT